MWCRGCNEKCVEERGREEERGAPDTKGHHRSAYALSVRAVDVNRESSFLRTRAYVWLGWWRHCAHTDVDLRKLCPTYNAKKLFRRINCDGNLGRRRSERVRFQLCMHFFLL